MQVRIRLQKAGQTTKGRANYRIVAISRERSRQSRNLDIIGYYDAQKDPAVISIDQDKLKKWVDNGAQMSDTVKSLVKKTQKTAKA